MKNQETVIAAIEALRVHPFTLIQLSDKEKFHTGMLCYALNKYPILFKTIFKLKEVGYIACVEEDSIDLLIKHKGEVVLIVESKFKTGLHKSKAPNDFGIPERKYISQLEKIKHNNNGLGANGYYLLSLFGEKDEGNLESQFGFIGIQFTDIILKSLQELEIEVRGLSEEDSLIILWIKYLEQLKIIVDYFVKSEMNSIDNPNIKKLLKSIKLNGVFESYRYGLVQQKVEEKLSHKIKESLKVSCENRNELEQVGELFNSHGNGGIHYALATEDAAKSFGIQWQGALKLFIETTKPSLKEGVREICKALNFKSTVKKDDVPKKPSSGKFSSLSIQNDWDIYGGINDKPEEIVKYLKSLNQNIIKKIVINQD